MIYYLCPDFEPPSGGTRAIYRHVALLHEAGFQACVVHKSDGFSLDWHGIPAPVIALSQITQAHGHDIWVIPEGDQAAMQALAPLPGIKLLNALNWVAPLTLWPTKENLQTLGIVGAITPSRYIQHLISWGIGIECVYTPEAIDVQALAVESKASAPLSIAYMPRKVSFGDFPMHAIQENPTFSGALQWLALDGLNQAQYQAALKQAHIYLAMGHEEGLNVSVLEAMATRALVIGFHGGGGQEYMIGSGPEQNCLLVDNGDPLSLGLTLENAIQHLLRNPAHYERIQARALVTAQGFGDPATELRHLVDFFQPIVDKSNS